MPVTIGKPPENDFSNPIGMLSDCHRRIERFLGVLVLVAEQAGGGALTAEQREAFETALRYFRVSGPRHTEDEESSLFPRMRNTGTKRAEEVLAKLDSLHADHVKAEEDHRIVEKLGQDWLSHGTLKNKDVRELSAALTRLHQLYAGHIACEDEEVFPLAAEILDKAQIREIAREMATRRGL